MGTAITPATEERQSTMSRYFPTHHQLWLLPNNGYMWIEWLWLPHLNRDENGTQSAIRIRYCQGISLKTNRAERRNSSFPCSCFYYYYNKCLLSNEMRCTQKILVFAETKVNFFSVWLLKNLMMQALVLRIVVVFGVTKTPSKRWYLRSRNSAVLVCVHNQKVSFLTFLSQNCKDANTNDMKVSVCACVCGIYQRIWRLVKIKKYNFINFILFHFFIFEFVCV